MPDISKWNINKVNFIYGLFYGCSSLKFIPDISKWNINNISKFTIPDLTDSKEEINVRINNNMITNISFFFYECSSLKELPDISKWNINPVLDMSYLFYGCSSLVSLPDISKWNTNNAFNISYLFYGCTSLKQLPDISKWDISNVKDISYMFYSCSSLKILPDISKWNTNNINNLNSIFENCSLLTFIPNISKWKFKNRININNIFKGCNLLVIPDISKWNINYPTTSLYISSFFSNSISIKNIKSDSLLSEDIIKNFSISKEDSYSLKGNKDIKQIENFNSREFSDFTNNEELNNYYDNFYD